MELIWKPEHLKRNTDSTVSNTKTQTHNLFPSHKQYFKTNSLLEGRCYLKKSATSRRTHLTFLLWNIRKTSLWACCEREMFTASRRKKKLPDFEPLRGCKSAGRKGVLIIQHVKNQISRLQTKAGEH